MNFNKFFILQAILIVVSMNLCHGYYYSAIPLNKNRRVFNPALLAFTPSNINFSYGQNTISSKSQIGFADYITLSETDYSFFKWGISVKRIAVDIFYISRFDETYNKDLYSDNETDQYDFSKKEYQINLAYETLKDLALGILYSKKMRAYGIANTSSSAVTGYNDTISKLGASVSYKVPKLPVLASVLVEKIKDGKQDYPTANYLQYTGGASISIVLKGQAIFRGGFDLQYSPEVVGAEEGKNGVYAKRKATTYSISPELGIPLSHLTSGIISNLVFHIVYSKTDEDALEASVENAQTSNEITLTEFGLSLSSANDLVTISYTTKDISEKMLQQKTSRDEKIIQVGINYKFK